MFEVFYALSGHDSAAHSIANRVDLGLRWKEVEELALGEVHQE